MNNFFQSLAKSFSSAIDVAFSQTEIFKTISILLIIFLAIRIAYIGLLAIYGRTDNPASETIFLIFKYVIIMAIAGNYNNYLEMALKGVESLQNIAGDSGGAFKTLDKMLVSGNELAGLLYEKGNMFSGTLAGLIVWIGMFIATAAPFFVLMVNLVVLKVLFLISPIFICCLLVGWFKNFFSQWLSLVMSNILTSIFIGLFLKIITDFFNGNITKVIAVAKDDVNIFLTAGLCLVICILCSILCKLSASLAQSITQVSIESTAMSKASNFVAGTAANAQKVRASQKYAFGKIGSLIKKIKK